MDFLLHLLGFQFFLGSKVRSHAIPAYGPFPTLPLAPIVSADGKVRVI